MARTIRNTVHTAAKELDELHPGWAYKVRLHDLDVNDPWRCILGQLYGSYDQGVDALDVDHTSNLYDATEGTAFNDPRVDRYNDEWKCQVRARRGRSGTNRNPQRLRTKLGQGPRDRLGLGSRTVMGWAN